MLILGLVDIQNLDALTGQRNRRPVRSCVLSKQSDGNYFVSVKNALYPNSITYNVDQLEDLHCKFIKDGKLGLRFTQPNHLVLIHADDKLMIKMFLSQIQDILVGKSVMIGTRHMPRKVPPKRKLMSRFNPISFEFVADNHFDKRILNMKHLNRLILENCNLPSLPIDIGNLPIECLSLTGSKLATTQFEQDTFWNWMSMKTISNTLDTLKMDSVDLKVLPFETLFLKNLRSLSVANNGLVIFLFFFFFRYILITNVINISLLIIRFLFCMQTNNNNCIKIIAMY